MLLGGSVHVLDQAHKIYAYISVRAWTNVHVIEFCADWIMYVKIKANSMSMV